jgi:hypothetical protein
MKGNSRGREGVKLLSKGAYVPELACPQERDGAMAILVKLQRSARLAHVHKLEMEIRALQEELTSQSALVRGMRAQLQQFAAAGRLLPLRQGQTLKALGRPMTAPPCAGALHAVAYLLPSRTRRGGRICCIEQLVGS